MESIRSRWLLTYLIFIPKPGKESYADPRSWRPISLMPFLLKTLERLILDRLQQTTLKENPHHRFQYAFRKGRSTDHALSHVTNIIERGILRENSTAGIYLDIEGAFDNASTSFIIKCMEKEVWNRYY